MLLVTSRNHNGWVVPGGGIESGEKAEHAAIRELQEEACVPETFYVQVINFTICHLQAGVVGAIIGSLGIFNVGKIICDLNILKCLFCHNYGFVQNESKKTKTTVFTAVATAELDTWPEAESTCT